MGDVVNLRRARKECDRRDKEKAAQANRVEYGRSKAERKLTDAQKRLDDGKFDAHRRDKSEDPA
jgi:hypothetical protein